MSEWELIDDLLGPLRLAGRRDGVAGGRLGGAAGLRDRSPPGRLPEPRRPLPLAPDWATLGPRGHEMPRLPDQLVAIDVATPEKPYRLVAAPARQFLNTSFTEMPTSRKREERPTALLHPETMAQLGLKDGSPVQARQREGLGTAPHQGARRPEPDHDRGREHLAERLLRRRASASTS